MQWDYACRVRFLPSTSWVVLSCRWEPHKLIDVSSSVLANRSRGRPFLKWDAKLAAFSMAIFRRTWVDVLSHSDWIRQKDTYLRWCAVLIPSCPDPIVHPVPVTARPNRNVAHVPFFPSSV